MDKQTFTARMYHAELMSETGDSPDYWEGYKRGLTRAYHGDQFGTEAEHKQWSLLLDSENSQDHERGRGYLDGLKADTEMTSRAKAWPWSRSIGLDAVIIITLITAILYLFGVLHYESYLRAFGLHHTQFPQTVHRYLVHGFTSGIDIVFDALIYVGLPVIGLAGGFLIGNYYFELIKQHKRQWADWLQSSWRRFTKNTSEQTPMRIYKITEIALAIAGYLVLFAFVLFGFLIISLRSASFGEKSANRFIERCEASERKNAVLLSSETAQEEKQSSICGCTIACNSDQCAYLVVSDSGFGNLTTVITNKNGRIYSKIELPELAD